jgi:hypothetical protein
MYGLNTEEEENKNYIHIECTKLLLKWPHKSEDSEVYNINVNLTVVSCESN